MLYPAIHSKVYYSSETEDGVPYLKHPACVLIGAPNVQLEGAREFLEGFDKRLEFGHYLDDPDAIPHAEQSVKFAGQVCYLSFGPKRSWNKDALKYITHIMESGHGSVLEHANFTFLFYGISRSCTHELVRHRVGIGFSQVSQRYVDGTKLRFVERAEYQRSDELHALFLDYIERAATEYDARAALLKKLYHSQEGFTELPATEQRKTVNQSARACLPNETEAPIVVTANVRTIRHILKMRAAKPAEAEIRFLAMKMYECVQAVAPLLFADYAAVAVHNDAGFLTTRFPTV